MFPYRANTRSELFRIVDRSWLETRTPLRLERNELSCSLHRLQTGRINWSHARANQECGYMDSSQESFVQRWSDQQSLARQLF